MAIDSQQLSCTLPEMKNGPNSTFLHSRGQEIRTELVESCDPIADDNWSGLSLILWLLLEQLLEESRTNDDSSDDNDTSLCVYIFSR